MTIEQELKLTEDSMKSSDELSEYYQDENTRLEGIVEKLERENEKLKSHIEEIEYHLGI